MASITISDYTLPRPDPLPSLQQAKEAVQAENEFDFIHDDDIGDLGGDSDAIIVDKEEEEKEGDSKTTTAIESSSGSAFIDMLAPRAEQNLARTENDALTYASTMSARLDLFFEVIDGVEEKRVHQLLDAAWAENALDTLKLIFQLRDIRDGKGEKNVFYYSISWLRKHHPETFHANLQLLPLVGYWKDLANILLQETIGKSGQEEIDAAYRKRTSERGRRYQPTAWKERHHRLLKVRKDFKEQCEKDAGTDGLSDEKFKELCEIHRKERILQNQKEMLQRKKEAKENRQRRSTQRRNLVRRLIKEDAGYRRLHLQVALLFATALSRDKVRLEAGKSVSLASKWAPTPSGHHDKYTLLATTIAELLYPAEKHRNSGESTEAFVMRIRGLYSKHYLTPLRSRIPVVEGLMSRGKWSEIKYDHVPSVCMHLRKSLFTKHDKDRLSEFLGKVKEGKAKIQSNALMPHQLVEEAMKSYHQYLNRKYNDLPDDDDKVDLEKETLEAQWKAYVDRLREAGTFESSVAVCDVSGSMYGTPMSAAIAFSLLITELTAPPFNQLLITFSARPKIHMVEGETLYERVENVSKMEAGFNTNFQAVFDLILERAKSSQLAPEQMVKRLFIFTDMEFDTAAGSNAASNYHTSYEQIVEKFNKAGYKVPEMIFWNLRGSNRSAEHGASKPVTKDQPGTSMLSGFSGQMLKMFLDGRLDKLTPWHTMRAAIDLTKYVRLTVID